MPVVYAENVTPSAPNRTPPVQVFEIAQYYFVIVQATLGAKAYATTGAARRFLTSDTSFMISGRSVSTTITA